MRRVGYDEPAARMQQYLAMGGVGILVIGASGVGKTTFALSEFGERGELVMKLEGEGNGSLDAARIDDFFRSAVSAASADTELGSNNIIVFIDDIDRIELVNSAPMCAALTTMWIDECLSLKNATVVATAPSIASVRESWRRSGRLDRIIELHSPSPADRLVILSHLTGSSIATDDPELIAAANASHGLVAGDLEPIAAALKAKTSPTSLEDTGIETDWRKALSSTLDRIQSQIGTPESHSQSSSTASRRNLDDFHGQSSKAAIHALMSSVVSPTRHPGDLKQLGITPPRGVLLYGPSGTGKTGMCIAAAHQAGLTVINIAGPQLLSRVVGESERAVAGIFERASACAPCVLLLDQIESIGTPRGQAGRTLTSDRVLSTLLSEIDAAAEGVCILATTQKLDDLDSALRRPGRFDEIVNVPLPDDESRFEILSHFASKLPTTLQSAANSTVPGDGGRELTECLRELARRTRGCSGAFLEGLCREAALCALRENIDSKEVVEKHFIEAAKLLL